MMPNITLRNAAGSVPAIRHTGKVGCDVGQPGTNINGADSSNGVTVGGSRVGSGYGTGSDLPGRASEGSTLTNSSEDEDPVGVRGRLGDLTRLCFLCFPCCFFFAPEE
ncbi:hypothetical protein NDU88_008968 [Pleurodeles waltl]|uniref:Uncharacterized protein n=1 Tax=Pleurodeles waltl TaxID=8319 RepID=A0AAV7RYF0_PLEWA|nr:hypothetical protein NDU88_008968 [Pleurodeles waltl]